MEDGFTLPEFLTVAALLVGLMGVMGAALTVTAGTEPRIAERSAQIQNGRVMIERLTRELREGSGLEAPTATSVSFLTFVRTDQCGGTGSPASAAAPAIECRVSYSCSAGDCTRTEAPPTNPGAGRTSVLLEGLRTSEVFGYAPASNPEFVTVTLEFPAEDGGESVTMSDGAAMRNVG